MILKWGYDDSQHKKKYKQKVNTETNFDSQSFSVFLDF